MTHESCLTSFSDSDFLDHSFSILTMMMAATTTLSSLEMENGDDKTERDDTRRRDPKWLVIVRYVSLSTVAVLLTITCPGNTCLWTSSGKNTTVAGGKRGEHELQYNELAKIIAIYVLVETAFFVLSNSDPGYLTAEMLSNHLDDDDGLSLLVGYEDNNKEEDGPQQQNLEDEEEKDVEKTSLTLDKAATRSRHFSSSAKNHNVGTLMNDATAVVDPLSKQTHSDDDKSTNNEYFFQGTRRKICEICQFAPPLRSHHCRQCNRCVATFDHHCNLIGKCVGERNHCRFWYFLVLQYAGFWICCNVVGSSQLGLTTLLFHQQDFGWDAMQVVIAKLYLYPLTAFAFIMLIIHTVFSISNSTTFECNKGPRHLEYLKGTREMDLPFSKGIRHNLRAFCCQRDGAVATTPWKPTLWQAPGRIVRDSEDWWEHPWQNKYWSCC